MALNRGSTGLSVYQGSTRKKVYRGSTLILDAEDSAEWTGDLRAGGSGSSKRFGSVKADGFENEDAFSGFQIPASWMAGDTVAYVRSFFLEFGTALRRLILRLDSNDSGFGTDAGPDFISELEGNLIIEVSTGGVTRTIYFSDGTQADTAEPYTRVYLSGNDSYTSVDELLGLSNGEHTTTIKLINPN